tara:strand:+ start:1143 stop:1403 length:261 start_codon:yes stop_codon:yes gene_type:complete
VSRRVKYSKNYLADSNWVLSDISGFKYPASECVYGAPPENGLVMHYTEYSAYNPQYQISPHPDDTTVAMNRPRQVQVFDTSFPTFD